MAITLSLRVLCGSQNKRQTFPCTTLTRVDFVTEVESVNARARYELNLYVIQKRFFSIVFIIRAHSAASKKKDASALFVEMHGFALSVGAERSNEGMRISTLAIWINYFRMITKVRCNHLEQYLLFPLFVNPVSYNKDVGKSEFPSCLFGNSKQLWSWCVVDRAS